MHSDICQYSFLIYRHGWNLHNFVESKGSILHHLGLIAGNNDCILYQYTSVSYLEATDNYVLCVALNVYFPMLLPV